MSNGTAFRHLGLGQVSVNVHDLPRAISFYRDVLGLKFLFEVPKLAFFEAGGVRLMLAIPETPEFDHPASILYYKVDDIRKAHGSIAARGATTVAEPHLVAALQTHDLWMASFRDSEGNTLALMCEVARG